MPPRALKLPVPTTIITGSLNSGKTTFISRLLQLKPPDAVWAVLVNEFGAVGLDAIALQNCTEGQDATLHVKQIAGGCMCCTTAGVLGLSIAQLLRSVKPDRLLIEPSGLGHPAGLIDTLQGQHLRTALQLNGVLCMVDLSRFDGVALMSEPIFADQVNICNILVGTKPDTCNPQQQEQFLEFAAQLFPPKQQVVLSNAPHQQLLALLDTPRDVDMRSIFTAKKPRKASSRVQTPAAELGSSHQQQQHTAGSSGNHADQQQEREDVAERMTALSLAEAATSIQRSSSNSTGSSHQLLQRCSSASPADGFTSCGWTVKDDCRFDQRRLLKLVQLLLPLAARFKGVARVSDKEWMAWGVTAGVSSQLVEAPDANTAAFAALQPPAITTAAATGATDPAPGPTTAAAAAAAAGVTHAPLPSHQPAHVVELQQISYRGPSCFQVILSTEAAPPSQQQQQQQQEPQHVTAVQQHHQHQQKQEDSSIPAKPVDGIAPASVAAAVAAAQQGDWLLLERLVLQCVQ